MDDNDRSSIMNTARVRILVMVLFSVVCLAGAVTAADESLILLGTPVDIGVTQGSISNCEYTSATLCDWDNDGSQELLLGFADKFYPGDGGNVLLFQNEGTAADPMYVADHGEQIKVMGQDIFVYAC